MGHEIETVTLHERPRWRVRICGVSIDFRDRAAAEAFLRQLEER
jgi:hypothetical protein